MLFKKIKIELESLKTEVEDLRRELLLVNNPPKFKVGDKVEFAIIFSMVPKKEGVISNIREPIFYTQLKEVSYEYDIIEPGFELPHKGVSEHLIITKAEEEKA